MTSHAVTKRIATLTALALALMVGIALTMPTQAHASETSLTVGTQSDEAKTINTTKSFTWIKAGKKLYQWGNYEKKGRGRFRRRGGCPEG